RLRWQQLDRTSLSFEYRPLDQMGFLPPKDRMLWHQPCICRHHWPS
ncbi:hypothetical protein D047_4321B, partial [Vibrio parahaemolyticus VPTS-2010_2]